MASTATIAPATSTVRRNGVHTSITTSAPATARSPPRESESASPAKIIPNEASANGRRIAAPARPRASAPGMASASNVASVLGCPKEPWARPVAVSPAPWRSGALPPEATTAIMPTAAAERASTNRRLRTVSRVPSSTIIW